MNYRFLPNKTSNKEKMLKQGFRGAIIELYNSLELSRIQYKDSFLLKKIDTYEMVDGPYEQK